MSANNNINVGMSASIRIHLGGTKNYVYRRACFVAVLLSLACTCAMIYYPMDSPRWSSLSTFVKQNFKTHISQNIDHMYKVLMKPDPHDEFEACTDVLSQMTIGHWKTRPLNKTEQEYILAFLSSAHTRWRLPENYQRPDGLCGNVTYTGPGHYFRALCDPKGYTPCCYHNKCAMKTTEECLCKDCYDLRQMKHAEYSSWIPSNPYCHYKEYSSEEACRILNGSTLVLVGDSLVRHIFTALQLVVSGDKIHGAISNTSTNDERNLCAGMYMFTEKQCRLLLRRPSTLCSGHVKIIYHEFYHLGYGQELKTVINSLSENSLVVFGIGIHAMFNHIAVQQNYINPSVNSLKAHHRTWPRLLWLASHAPGVMKSPVLLSQNRDSVKRFNKEMEPFLKSLNIPIFNTFNLTDGMMSFDGQHYSLGINLAKANILLNYINELRSREKW